MALLERQVTYTYVVFDDQGPGLWNNYVGNWTRYSQEGFFNHTFTATPTPGSSVSLNFSGSQMWIYGGVMNNSDGSTSGYPTAEYIIDGVSSGPQKPSHTNGYLLYFETGKLPDGPHTLEISVLIASDAKLFILDEIDIVPSAGVYSSAVTTTTMSPSSSSTLTTPTVMAQSKSTPVGTIVGGAVGGVAVLVILVVGIFYLILMIRRTRDSQDNRFERPSRLTEAFPGEYLPEPFDITASGSQFAYSEGSSSRPLNPSRGQIATGSHPPQHTQSGSRGASPTYTSSDTSRPMMSRKAALVTQQYEDVEQPGQHQGSPPSEAHTEVPPTYRPN